MGNDIERKVVVITAAGSGLGIVDRPTGHMSSLEIRNPATGRTTTGLCLDQRHKHLPVRDAGRIIRCHENYNGEFNESPDA